MVAFAATVLLAIAQSAAPTAIDPVEMFTRRMDYYIRDGGEWTSPNPDYASNPSRQPHSYAYRWEWSLDRRIARLRIDGLGDGGLRVTFWEAIVAWHPGEKRAVMTQVGSAGAYAAGAIDWADDSTAEIRLTFHDPDGAPWEFRELDTLAGPDQFHTVSYRRVDGAWVQQRASTWTRVKRHG